MRIIAWLMILALGLFGLEVFYDEVILKPKPCHNIVFEDTFEGTDLDEQKWNTTLKVFGRKNDFVHNSSYANVIDPKNVIVNNGLFLKNTKIGEDKYASGMISSHEKFVFRYGYIELYAKYPSGNGLWPAFWLMPQDQTWPPEIDVAEYYGGSKIMHTGLCYGDFPTVNWDSGGFEDVNIENSFCTYALYWSPTMLVWYFNGEVMKVVKGNYVPRVPMYIIISNGVSTEIGPSGVPDQHTIFPNSFQIRYIRVYR